MNEWIQEGIPFCTSQIATKVIDQFRLQQVEKQIEDSSPTPTPAFNQRRRVELTRTEDRDFHARAMASLREWLDAAIIPNHEDSEGASFFLPPCNSFLRRALYESISSEYPNLVLETVHQSSQIRVWRLNAEERKCRTKRLRRESFEKTMSEKVGVWRVFLALIRACSGQGPQSVGAFNYMSDVRLLG